MKLSFYQSCNNYDGSKTEKKFKLMLENICVMTEAWTMTYETIIYPLIFLILCVFSTILKGFNNVFHVGTGSRTHIQPLGSDFRLSVMKGHFRTDLQ